MQGEERPFARHHEGLSCTRRTRHSPAPARQLPPMRDAFDPVRDSLTGKSPTVDATHLLAVRLRELADTAAALAQLLENAGATAPLKPADAARVALRLVRVQGHLDRVAGMLEGLVAFRGPHSGLEH